VSGLVEAVPAWRRWTGRTLSALVTLFLLFDGTIKLIKIQPVVDSFTALGYSPDISRGIGVLELILVGLYVVPRTSVFGAVLLTGLLGGAMASHLRVADPLFSHVLFSIYLAIPLWGGLYLRDRRLAAIAPWRS
jgi:hypothetical protein